jgi:hypothetical protein
VRGSAYPEQTAEEICAIQGQFEQYFFSRIGLGPSRAQKLIRAIIPASENHYHEMQFELQRRAEEYYVAWKLAREHKNKSIMTAPERDFLSRFKKGIYARGFGYIECLNELAPLILPVGHIDVAATKDEWDSLCLLLGMTPEVRAQMNDPVEVRERPLFVMPDGRCMLAGDVHALDIVWERYDELARADPVFYEVYQRHKAAWLEAKTVACLERIFPSCAIFSKLSYPDPDKPRGSTTELDIAIYWKPFLIFIEAKAKQFRLKSQLGDIGRLRDDVKANVENAFEQASRAARYLNSSQLAIFTEIAGGRRVLKMAAGEVRNIYLLTVCLHELAGMTTELALAQDLGLFRQGDYPVAMCSADLDLVTQFCSGPDMFLHYLKKRLDILHADIDVQADEIELFGAYLDTRLREERLWRPRKDERRPNFVSLSGWQDQFDLWIAHKNGKLPEPPDIKLDLPAVILEILRELRARTDDEDARWIAFALLDLSDRSLRIMAEKIREIRAAGTEPGKFRRWVYQEGDVVLSIIASSDQSSNALQRRVAEVVIIEKYRRKTGKALAIGIDLRDKKKPFDAAAWAEGPWEQDSRLDRALEQEPVAIPTLRTKLPGRNEPCICGSGKKFKKCCLQKIEMARWQAREKV